VGTLVMLVAVQLSVLGLYLAPVFKYGIGVGVGVGEAVTPELYFQSVFNSPP
jgi:hypothetical protein